MFLSTRKKKDETQVVFKGRFHQYGKDSSDNGNTFQAGDCFPLWFSFLLYNKFIL